MVSIEFANINTELEIQINNDRFKCIIVEKPFFDPKKQITAKNL
tara:strand:+ start:323 stop:454 length:132 start_codon:yes stop_codon:yes gene_type:complete